MTFGWERFNSALANTPIPYDKFGVHVDGSSAWVRFFNQLNALADNINGVSTDFTLTDLNFETNNAQPVTLGVGSYFRTVEQGDFVTLVFQLVMSYAYATASLFTMLFDTASLQAALNPELDVRAPAYAVSTTNSIVVAEMVPDPTEGSFVIGSIDGSFFSATDATFYGQIQFQKAN